MADNMKWNGDAIKAKLAAEIGRRLDASAIVVTNRAKVLLSVDGTAKGAPGRNAAGRYTKGRLVYGANPSRPGEPPRLQTGRLRGSMAWERTGYVARVGTNVVYARPLEIRLNRPFLIRALDESSDRIRAILSAPMNL